MYSVLYLVNVYISCDTCIYANKATPVERRLTVACELTYTLIRECRSAFHCLEMGIVGQCESVAR